VLLGYGVAWMKLYGRLARATRTRRCREMERRRKRWRMDRGKAKVKGYGRSGWCEEFNVGASRGGSTFVSGTCTP